MQVQSTLLFLKLIISRTNNYTLNNNNIKLSNILNCYSTNSTKNNRNNNSKMTSVNDLIEKGKKCAAYKAIDENIDSNTKTIGIGSGSTIVYAIERLAYKVKQENLIVQCIPSSFQSKQAILQHGLNITELDQFTTTDVAIDGADEVDKHLNCIKGGGGCHLQEKLVAYSARKFILIADIRKNSEKLGDNWSNGIPIEVLPMSYRLVQQAIEKLLGGQAILRQSPVQAKAGPVVTDNSNFIIDWKFDSNKLILNDQAEVDWNKVNTTLSMIPGVIETGLFLDMAKIAYFGNFEGGVSSITKK